MQRAHKRITPTYLGPVAIKRRRYGRKYRQKTRTIVSRYNRPRGQKPLWNWNRTPFPDSYGTSLLYDEGHDTWDPGVTGAYDFVYRGNSIYDPYYTGGGNTVIGWAALGDIYNYYKVISSRVTLELRTINATNPCMAVIYPSIDSSQITNPHSIKSMPGVVMMELPADGATRKITAFARTSDVYSRKKYDDDMVFASTFGLSPSGVWFWHVIIWNEEGATNVNIGGSIHIEYNTVCFGRKLLGANGVA